MTDKNIEKKRVKTFFLQIGMYIEVYLSYGVLVSFDMKISC